MPEDYFGQLNDGINEFDFNGTTYRPGDKFGPFDACQAKAFIAAAIQANEDRVITEEQQAAYNQLLSECPDPPNTVEPQPGQSTSPTETQPNPSNGDTALDQGASTPPVSLSIGRSATGSSTDSTSPPTEEQRRPPEGEQHPTHGGERPQQQTDGGEPVDIFRGVFYLQETDLVIPNTLLPLVFTRIYRSGSPAFSSLGWNWDHNHNIYMRELNNGNIALWRNLHEDEFKDNGSSFEPPRGVFEKLERVAGLVQTYELTAEGGVVMRFERPFGWIDGERIPLVWIKDRHGNKLYYTYGAEDKIKEVRDDDNRYLRFDYDVNGLLVAVSDHSGRKYTYEYNEETIQLVYVNIPSTTDYPNGISKAYYYDSPFALPELRNNIIRIEDSEGRVYLENKYEEDPASWSYARVKEQLYGGYLFQYRYTQLQWVPSDALYINIPAVRVELLNPDLGLETYTFNYRGDLLDKRFRLNKDKSFRVVIWQYEYDEQGNLSKTIEPNGSSEILTYDFSNADPRMRGKLLKRELTSALVSPAPSRIVWRGKYEPNYQLLIEETNESHATTKYKYDFDSTPAAPTNTGKLERIIYPDATLPDGTIQNCITLFQNNQKGQTEAIILPDGTRHEMVYGVVGTEKSRLIKERLDVNNLNIEKTIKYDSYGYKSEMIDGNGNTSKNIYNALGLLEKNILPPVNGVSAEYVMHYDSDKKLVELDRPKGSFIDPGIAGKYIIDKFERNILGYPIKYHFSNNTNEKRDIKVCPDFRGYPIKILNPDNSLIIRIYDERGLLIRQEVKGPDSSTLYVNHIYDTSGRLIKDVNANRVTTNYEYDGFGRLTRITYSNGTKKVHKWGKNDVLLSEEIVGDDGFGNIRLLSKKSYSYDEKNRRIKMIEKSFAEDPNISTDLITTFYYDKLDRIIKVIDNKGGIKTFEYDGLNRLISEIDPEGNQGKYFYDNNGNTIKTESWHKEPSGDVSILKKTYVYDTRNRRIETIEPDGAKTTEKYDDRNVIISRSDYLGITTEFEYDSFGNKVHELHDPGNLAISHTWVFDNMSRIAVYKDPTGQITYYYYDGIGQLVKTVLPNGFSSTRNYNTAGQVIKEELGSGVTFEYEYDIANRLIKINNTIAPVSITQVQQHLFSYDGLDRVLSAQIGTNKVLKKYDSRNRLILEETAGNSIRCSYDDNAGTVDKYWPDGRIERYEYNLNNVLQKITRIANGALGSGGNLIVSFSPSGANYFGEANYQGNNLKISAQYDERKRLTDLTISSPSGTDEKIKYRFDTANRKRVEALLGQNPKINYYDFDEKSRLINSRDGFTSSIANAATQIEHDNAVNTVKAASAAASHEEKFVYDAADARTKYSETGNADKNYTYLPGHKIQNDGINNYNYFIDGIMQSDGQFSYEIDALGRVITIKAGANILCRLEYDALGRPSAVYESGKPARSFNYFGDFVVQENDNNNLSRQITLHPVTGIPIAYHTNNRSYYTLFDGRSNLIGLADTGGNLIETYRYKSFGLPNITDAAGNIVMNSLFGIEPIFGGQKYISSIGLYLSKRRLMNPLHGFYLSPDPRGYVNSASLYVYAAQNPIDLIDPNGEFAFLAILAVMAIGAGIAAAINATRQGIQIAEGSRQSFSWGELGLSAGIGAVAAPVLVAAPELAVPLAAWGVAGGVEQFREGNYATGTFDVVTSLAPFGFKGVRSATFGRGTVIGEMRGLGETASWGTRVGRFGLIENNLRNFVPSPFGRRVGLGFARSAIPGDPQGHAAVIIEREGGGFWFVEKNMDPSGTVASFRPSESPLEIYTRRPAPRPFEYNSMRISRSLADRAMNYAQERLNQNLIEPFDQSCANCSHFAGDVLNEAGFSGLGNGRASGLYSDFVNLGIGRNMTYASPFLIPRPSTTSGDGKK